MLDRIPIEIAKWILMIPAVVAAAAGVIAAMFTLTVMLPGKPDWDALFVFAGVGSVFHLVVIAAYASIRRYDGGNAKLLGYSRGFWLSLIALGYLAGIGLGIFLGPAK